MLVILLLGGGGGGGASFNKGTGKYKLYDTPRRVSFPGLGNSRSCTVLSYVYFLHHGVHYLGYAFFVSVPPP